MPWSSMVIVTEVAPGGMLSLKPNTWFGSKAPLVDLRHSTRYPPTRPVGGAHERLTAAAVVDDTAEKFVGAAGRATRVTSAQTAFWMVVAEFTAVTR